MRRLLPLVLLLSGCDFFSSEYLLSGEATLTGALTLLTNGRGFDAATLSVERGAEFANEGRANLRQLQGCTVDLAWDIDASGQTTVKPGSQLLCDGVLTPLSGSIDVRDYAVDDVAETSGETGAKVTLGVDGVRDPGGMAVMSGTTTLAFGTLASGGTGGGSGGGNGGGAGGCDLTFEGQRFTSTWARCPRAEFMGGVPQVLTSYPSDLSWEVNFATYNGQRVVTLQLPSGTTVDGFTSTGITISGETFTVNLALRDGQLGNPRGALVGSCTCNDY